jgi:hypothetical protein
MVVSATNRSAVAAGLVFAPVADDDLRFSQAGELLDVDVALMKRDAQGAGLEVLEGAERILARTTPVLVEATFVSHYDAEASFSRLHVHKASIGFAPTGLSDVHRSPRGEAYGLMLPIAASGAAAYAGV